MSLIGIYLGVVEKVGDPEKLGRLKVRVPGVYGVQGSVDAIPVDDLPWALPMGLPAGGSNSSGGFSMLPEVNDQVAVQFLDGEPEKPVWQYLMQSQPQAKTLKLHQYTAKTENKQQVAGTAARTIWTRYGHSVEIRPESVILTTKEGYQVMLQPYDSSAGGASTIQTPKGQSLVLNDARESIVLQGLKTNVISGKKVMLNAPTAALVKTGRFTVMVGTTMLAIQGNTVTVTTGSGASLIIDDSGNVAISSAGGASISLEGSKVQLGEPTGTGSIVLEAGKVSLNAPQFVMNTSACAVGTGAAYPVVLMSPQAMAWFFGHTHSNGNNGEPTGAPIMPFPQDGISKTMRTT